MLNRLELVVNMKNLGMKNLGCGVIPRMVLGATFQAVQAFVSRRSGAFGSGGERNSPRF
jgi:hypothetical protein